MDTRPTWTETFMRDAINISERSVLPTRVGAIIVQDRRQVCGGYNGKPSGAAYIYRRGDYELDEVHAEANAIAFAARRGIVTEGSSMYSTVRPCIHCAKLIIQGGIRTVYCFDKKANNQDACPDGVDLLNKYNIRVVLVKDE